MDLTSTFMVVLVVTVFVQVQATAKDTNLTSYWGYKLPQTPMPPSIQNYLPLGNETITQPQLRIPKGNGPIAINIYKCHHGSQKLNQNTTSLFVLAKDVLLAEANRSSEKLVVHPHFPSHKGEDESGHFLPRNVVEQMSSLNSTNLHNIFTTFNVTDFNNAIAAELIKGTVKMCENAAKDENVCITSLEDMIDFVEKRLGRSNIRAFSTSSLLVTKLDDQQAYKLARVKRVDEVNSLVTCHKVEFPYAVFLCHQRPSTVPYVAWLEGQLDGSTIEAVVVCHMDTSDWHPQFAGLVALNATPGTPVCHFLDQLSVLWVDGLP